MYKRKLLGDFIRGGVARLFREHLRKFLEPNVFPPLI